MIIVTCFCLLCCLYRCLLILLQVILYIVFCSFCRLLLITLCAEGSHVVCCYVSCLWWVNGGQTYCVDDIHASVPGALDESGENDCNNNTSSLCEDCGQLNGCQCTWSMADDHCYAAYRPTVRTHNRTGVKLTRKRTRNCNNWKSVQRKRLRQGGKVYVMSTGAMAEGEAVKSCKGDHGTCRFKCAFHFDEVSRQTIHTEHWCLSDDDKRQFYIHTTTKKGKARTRRAADVNKKKMSYAYYLSQHNHKIRVCKEFYLKTLHIDAKRIVNTHLAKNNITGTPKLYVRGKHTKKANCAQRASIQRHIESIPTIESLLSSGYQEDLH